MSLSLVHRLLGRSLSVLLVLSLLCNSTPAATLDNCWRSNRVASGPRSSPCMNPVQTFSTLPSESISIVCGVTVISYDTLFLGSTSAMTGTSVSSC